MPPFEVGEKTEGFEVKAKYLVLLKTFLCTCSFLITFSCLFRNSIYIYIYMSLSYTDHLVSIVPFIYDYLNFTTILLCLCFYSLFYHFVNLTFICNNNNLYIRLSFHCTYDTDEEIRDFEIYLSVILNDVILMLILPHIFKWFFDIYIYN